MKNKTIQKTKIKSNKQKTSTDSNEIKFGMSKMVFELEKLTGKEFLCVTSLQKMFKQVFKLSQIYNFTHTKWERERKKISSSQINLEKYKNHS
uniref:Uncharacterized protein n=1 Tax=Octopus bimaculoides TaxID=37653 RepID=A0A0L8GHX7_OCTBM